MNDTVQRTLRTFIQAAPVSIIIQVYNIFAQPPLDAVQIIALTTLGTGLFSFLQNMLEESGTIPTILKDPVVPDGPTNQVLQDELVALANAFRVFRLDLTTQVTNLPREDSILATDDHQKPLLEPTEEMVELLQQIHPVEPRTFLDPEKQDATETPNRTQKL